MIRQGQKCDSDKLFNLLYSTMVQGSTTSRHIVPLANGGWSERGVFYRAITDRSTICWLCHMAISSLISFIRVEMREVAKYAAARSTLLLPLSIYFIVNQCDAGRVVLAWCHSQ